MDTNLMWAILCGGAAVWNWCLWKRSYNRFNLIAGTFVAVVGLANLGLYLFGDTIKATFF